MGGWPSWGRLPKFIARLLSDQKRLFSSGPWVGPRGPSPRGPCLSQPGEHLTSSPLSTQRECSRAQNEHRLCGQSWGEEGSSEAEGPEEMGDVAIPGEPTLDREPGWTCDLG